MSKSPPTPIAEKRPYSLEKHGDVRGDPYYWLKDRDDPKVLKYLRAENTYLEKILKPTQPLQKQLYEELKSRLKPDDVSVPEKEGPYFYYQRMEAGKEYPIFCRKKESLTHPEEIILDANELAKGHDYFHVRRVKHNPQHDQLAYAVDTVGRRFYTIYFKDLHTGKLLPDQIPSTTGDFEWASDNQTILYVKQHPDTLRAEKVLRHTLGGSQDDLVFEEKDETFDVSLDKTKTQKFLIIYSDSTLVTEARMLLADHPRSIPKIFQPRESKHEYHVEDGGDRFYILTNYRAKNFRLMETPYGKTAKKYWKEVIKHRQDTLIEDVDVFKNFLALLERRGGLTQIQVVDRKKKKNHFIRFKDSAYVTWVDGNPEFNADWVRFHYESLSTPESVFDYHYRTQKRILKKQEEVLGGFDSHNYVSVRLFATAKDKMRIPISVVYRKGTAKSPDTPLLVVGYGAYGNSSDPGFDPDIISLLDRGFVYAIAHVRGGSELGRDWYENGRVLKKKNTFTDFIACTEHLIKSGFSSPKATYAVGASAGGLLIGAIVNMRPDLFNGVIAQVPFVDALTTMLDPSIPLTTAEYDEWGNPHLKKYYDYIKSYSPYDNVKAMTYPHILVTTGLHDSQVQYWEPAKWVAKLRELKTDKNFVLLQTEMHAGHSGKRGRYESLKEIALDYAFLLFLEDIKR